MSPVTVQSSVVQVRGQQTASCQIYPLLVFVSEVRIVFTSINGFKKNQRKNNVLWHVKIIYNSIFSLLNKIYWNTATLIDSFIVKYLFIQIKYSFIVKSLFRAAFALQWQSWIIATERVCPTKSKAFNII